MVENIKKGSGDKYDHLHDQCKNLETVNKEIEDLEKIVSEKKEYRMKLRDDVIPNLMEELNIKTWEFTDGTQIGLSPFYSAKLSLERKQECLDWLRDNGHGGLIKNFITVDLGMKKDEVAQKVLDYLKSLNISSEVKQDVHAQTLKAWFKTEVEEGRAVPSDLFQTYVTNRAKLT